MLIDDIEFLVTLMIGNIESDDVQEYNFSDFEAFNDFVNSNQRDSRYSSGPFYYTLVESIGGKPSAFCWTKEIEFVPFTKEQIAEEIEAQKEFLDELPTYANDMESYMKEIHYTEPADNYEEKTERLKDFAYVCPFCIREVEDCRCKHYPYYLMQIDRLILPVIRELNMKGYKTTGCCAGHPSEGYLNIYICFAEDYDFDEPFPDGGRYSKAKHSISYTVSAEDCDNLADFQRETLYKLSDWAEMLFELEEEE